MSFETGASTHEANNLVLSVMNDGAIYKDRLHVIFAFMQSASHHGMTIQDIVKSEAMKQRKEFGSKFNARDITEAARLIHDQTLTHCIEKIREEWTGDNFDARALLWFDKVNGNTYHSIRLNIPSTEYASGRIVDVPMSYGYGDQWKTSAAQALRKLGFTIPEVMRDMPINFGSAIYTNKRHMFEGLRYLTS